MGSLIRYEIKKFCSNRVLPVMLIILTALNVWLILGNISERSLRLEQQLDAFLDEYAADPEKLDAYIAEYNKAVERAEASRKIVGNKVVYSVPYPDSKYSENDRYLFNTLFLNIRDFPTSYAKMVKKATRVAEGHIREYEYIGLTENSFEIAYQRGVIQSYEKLTDIEFPMTNIRGYDVYFAYSGFGVIAMIAMLVGGMLILIPEKSGGMVSILRVSKRGRWETYLAKIITALLYAFVVCFLFSASALIAVALKGGLNGIEAPIQMIETDTISYRLCPFLITVGEGVVLSFLLRFFACFLFMMIIIALSAVFSGYVPAFLLGILFTAANYVTANYNFLNEYAPMKNLNFFWSINGKEPIVYWRGIRLFGKCVPMLDSLLLTYGILLAISLVVGGYLYTAGKGMEFHRIKAAFRNLFEKITALVKKWNLRIFLPHSRRRATHLGYEVKKILTPFALVILAGILGATFILSSQKLVREESFYDILYSQYMEEYGGEWTEEKDASLHALYREYQTTVSKRDMIEQQYSNGEISRIDYFNYLSELSYAQNRLEMVKELCRTSETLRALHNEGKMAYFVPQTNWKLLSEVNFSYLYLIGIILIFCNVYALEYRDGFFRILSSTKKGRVQTTVYKLSVVVMTTVLMVTVCEAIQYISVARLGGLPYAEAPARSLLFLADEGDVSIGGHFALLWLRQIAVAAGISLMAALLSRLTKKLLPTMAIVAAVSFAPMIFNYFGIKTFDALSFVTLLGRA